MVVTMPRTDDPRVAPELDWPAHYDRTPADDREPYPGDLSPTRKESFQSVVDELERWGATSVDISTASQHYVDRPNIPHQHDKPDDSGVVARFRREGEAADEAFAIACDKWATQRENARAIALYAQRMRLAEKCGVTTSQSTFDTARLPPAGGESEAVAAPPASSSSGMTEAEAREVLGVAASADTDVVEASARRLSRKHHPDSGEVPDRDLFMRVQKAKKALLV